MPCKDGMKQGVQKQRVCAGKIRERKGESKIMGKGNSMLSGKQGRGLLYSDFGVNHRGALFCVRAAEVSGNSL